MNVLRIGIGNLLFEPDGFRKIFDFWENSVDLVAELI